MTTPNPDALRRLEPCPACGEMMLWTQNAWAHGDSRSAAYQCLNGHVIDPAMTRECPSCGMHDTGVLELSTPGQTDHICYVCNTRFSRPR
jgi:endogenous inhibitor of DNA gyrase (YacG/DUF329 family)